MNKNNFVLVWGINNYDHGSAERKYFEYQCEVDEKVNELWSKYTDDLIIYYAGRVVQEMKYEPKEIVIKLKRIE